MTWVKVLPHLGLILFTKEGKIFKERVCSRVVS